MNRWERILDELARLLEIESRARTIAHRHARSVPAKEMGFEEVLKETRLRCSEYDPEITGSVRAWKWGQSLSKISEPAQMWRYVRLNTAVTWLALAIPVPGSERVLGEPLMTDEEVIRWLLADWWNLGGVQLRAMYEMGA